MTRANDNGEQCRRGPTPAPHVMTRHNGLVFYGLAAASFLETAIPLHATALLQVFAAAPEVQRWIEERWWPTKYAHGREARDYIEATWPEFDWSGAYTEFYESYRPLVCRRDGAGAPAREALVRSVAAAQASAFYRCLGTAADDGRLRQMLYRIGADESAHFSDFRRLFTRLDRGKRLGWLATYRTIVACARRARDVDVRLACARLGAPHWYGGTPFPELEYREFVQRMGAVVRRHLPLGVAQRWLFRTWWQAQRLGTTPAPQQRVLPRGRSAGNRAFHARAAH